MSQVVVLTWDPASSILECVQVNGGAGGDSVSVAINEEWAASVSDALDGASLPAVVDLEADDGDVLIEKVITDSVRLCAVTTRGSPGNRQFELKAKGASKPVATPPVTELGVADALAEFANGLKYLYAPTLTPPGCWLGCAGGIGPWLEEKHRVAEENRARRAMARRFINPYTFVPFPEHIQRCAPAGHHLLADGHLSGMFTVTWTFTSPFQAPDGGSENTVLHVPGSSVKGAVRSMHEALAGGCLRIFDEDFIPSYRDTPVARSTEWTLAQVATSTKDGQPLTVTLCDEVVWVRVEQLRKACGDSLSTGSRVTLDTIPEPNSLGRKDLSKDASVRRHGDWVVLVTQPGTRSKEKWKQNGTYFLACGRRSKRTAEVTESAWRAFQRAVAGANDLRPEVREQSGTDQDGKHPTEKVDFDERPVGYRRVVTGRLWSDDVVWVRFREQGSGPAAVEELSLSAIWRHPGWPSNGETPADPGKWGARERVPLDLLPCNDPGLLCPTCRIFGSADPNARDRDDRAEQRAYAGHIRFGTACSVEPVKLEPIKRAPLGSPRPGAGQFYLTYDDCSPAQDNESKPTREWGSAPDTPRTRRLRGRKFYWHADPQTQEPPRHKAREHQKGAKLAVDKWIAPAGTTLTQRVSFDNLSPAELGGLLAVFDPGRVLLADGRPLRIHLGGGKPLGLGSCTAAINGIRVWDVRSRYGGAPEITADPDAYVRAFRNSCPAEVTDIWPTLATVLAEGSVDAEHVWYPPGAYWPDRWSRRGKAFDEPFAFFTASSGMYLARGESRKLIPLPDPGSGDQSLEIVREDDLK